MAESPGVGGRPVCLRSGRTRGSVSIEAILIIPAFVLFLALILAIGRTAIVRSDIHEAVVAGARIASLERNSAAGKSAGTQAIKDHLAQEKVNCESLEITVDVAALDLPPGEPGAVSTHVSCVLTLSDLGVPGLDNEVTIQESFTTPVDTYENRPG